MRNRPKYLHSYATRHGKTAYYYRAPGERKIRLPNDYGTDRFWKAFEIAKTEGAVPVDLRERDMRRSLIGLLHTTRNRAKARGYEFALSLEWALDLARKQGFRCALTGIRFNTEWKNKSRANPFVPSIDRIDCERGYTPDNTRLVICAINLMMMDWGEKLFSLVATSYRKNGSARARAVLAPHRPLLLPEISSNEISVLQT